MLNVFIKENRPNAGLLTMALRHLGYDNYSALCDIMDNSLDAEASIVKLYINQVNKDIEIKIVDNGNGMTEEILDEALRLGSDVDRNLSSDLGKFGMGLCTASLSICRRIEVITKTKGSKLLKSVSDVDEIIEKNDFIKFLGEADDNDKKLFRQLLSGEESGTIIILKKCDNIKNVNLTQFRNSLKNEVARIFRMFIMAGKEFFINDEKIDAEDPLMLDYSETLIYSDENFDIKLKDSEGREIEENIRVRLVMLPDLGTDVHKMMKINIPNQGFYVMRNSREVLNAKSLNLFTKHNDLNRFRGEIWFNATLDEYMGVNFTKKNLDLHQSIYDKLSHIIAPQIKAIRNKCNSKRLKSENSDINHEESAKIITQKSHLLIKPKGEKEIRSSKQNTSNEQKTETKREKSRNNFTKSKPSDLLLNCRFDTMSMGRAGLMYDTYMEGKTVVIEWNIDHPFYERFVIANKEDKGMLTSVDFLIYSLASAELSTLSEENHEILDTLKSIMSSNMRTLLA